MKVYVLLQGTCNEGGTIHKIFSTKEKALEELYNVIDDSYEKYSETWYVNTFDYYYSIEEHEVEE